MPSETGLSGSAGASGGGGGGDASAANQVLGLTALDQIYDALVLVGTEATSADILAAVQGLSAGATLDDLAAALAPLATEATQQDVLAALEAQAIDVGLIQTNVALLVPDVDAMKDSLASIDGKIPASPAQDRTTFGAPSAVRIANAGASGFITPFVSGDAVAQSGTWNITNISGTISLPTGAATAAKQPSLGTAGTPSADVISVQGVGSGTPLPSSNAASSQADGHSATIGATGDADTATTLIGLLKWIKARLPTALVGGRLDVNVGNTPAVTVSSGSVTTTPSGTQNVAAANQAATAAFPIRVSYDGASFVGSGAVATGLSLPTAVPYFGSYLFAKQTGASTGHSVICSSVGALLIAGQSAVNSTASAINPILVCGQTGASTVNLLCDSSGRQIVVGPGASTPATSVSVTDATTSFTAIGAPTSAQNATTKASAGRLHGFRVRGASAGTYYLQWHDVASTGALGATQRGLGFEVAGAGDDFTYTFPKPVSFSTGITWALSTAIDSYSAAAGKTAYVDPIWE